MRKGWRTVALGEIADLQFGHAFKSQLYCEPQDGVRLIRGDNVVQQDIRWANAKYWPSARVEEVDNYLLKDGDVVLAMDRPWIDAGLKAAVMRKSDLPALLVQRVARMRATGDADQDFLRWLIFAPAFTKHVLNVQTGTAVPHISGGQIREYKFQLPPLDEQKRIAGVLGALDELIETNQQLIGQVRDLSAASFERLVLRSKGQYRLGDVAMVNDLKTKYQTQGSIQYLDIASLGNGTIEPLSEIKWVDAPSRARRLARDGSTLWSTVRPNRRAHALLVKSDDALVISTGVAVISPTTIGPAYLFAACERSEFTEHLVNRATGSAYPAVRTDDFADALIPRLSTNDEEQFEKTMWPLWVAANGLDAESNQLRRTRDELLPLLLSGKVSPGEIAA